MSCWNLVTLSVGHPGTEYLPGRPRYLDPTSEMTTANWPVHLAAYPPPALFPIRSPICTCINYTFTFNALVGGQYRAGKAQLYLDNCQPPCCLYLSSLPLPVFHLFKIFYARATTRRDNSFRPARWRKPGSQVTKNHASPGILPSRIQSHLVNMHATNFLFVFLNFCQQRASFVTTPLFMHAL